MHCYLITVMCSVILIYFRSRNTFGLFITAFCFHLKAATKHLRSNRNV